MHLEFAADASIKHVYKRNPAHGPHGPDHGHAHFGRGVVEIDEDFFALFDPQGIGGELAGELVEA